MAFFIKIQKVVAEPIHVNKNMLVELDHLPKQKMTDGIYPPSNILKIDGWKMILPFRGK